MADPAQAGEGGTGATETGAATGGVTFALAPGLVSDDVLDYSTPNGVKLYNKATAPLPVLFDLKPQNLTLFLENVRNRAIAYNWMGTLSITVGTTNLNLIDHYGRINIAQVRANASNYIGLQVRNAQNSMQIYTCLMSSLTEDAQQAVMIDASQYKCPAAADLEGPKYHDGPCLLKVIIMKAYVDTNATITTIKLRLMNLPHTMEDKRSNITDFNKYVKEQRSALVARGEKADSLLLQLFQGYAVADDAQFRTYIKRKADEYDEGNPLTADQLMLYAENYYKKKVENDTWNEPTEEQKKLVALTAKYEALQKANKKAADKKAKADKKKADKKGKGKDAKKKDDTEKKSKIPDWKLVAPKDGKTTMTRDGKKYYWCPNHHTNGMWVLHEPKDCNKGPDNPTDKKDNKTGAGDLKVSKALTAILEEEDEE